MQDNARVVLILVLIVVGLAGMGLVAWLLLPSSDARDTGRDPSAEKQDAELRARTTLSDEVTIAQRAVRDGGVLTLAVERFRHPMGRYPLDVGELVTRPESLEPDANWTGPYIGNARLLIDPWGNRYEIRAPGVHNPETFDLWSNGPDRQSGTDDDIGNW